MKFYLSLFLFLYSIIAFSQKTVDTQIVLKNKDTLNTKLIIPFNPGDSHFIILNNKNKREVIDRNLINSLSYIFDGKKINFDTSEDGIFRRIVFKGKKTSWYRMTSNNIYSGALSNQEIIINFRGTSVKIKVYKKSKDALKTITENIPELNSYIDSIEKLDEEKIISVLEKYDDIN